MVDSWKDIYTDIEQPQTILQYRRMIYQREYRSKIKANEIIYIKKTNIITKNIS